MYMKRHAHILMSALAAAFSAGGPIAAAATDKVTLVHAETAQECDFNDQGAADGFLAGVADPDSWKAKGALQLVGIDLAAGPDQGVVVDVDLSQLRDSLATEHAAEDAAAAAAPAPAPAPAQDPAPAPAAPAPEAPKASRRKTAAAAE